MTARVGLIGYPVGHSISPRFQQAAFDALGIDARYEAWELAPDELAGFVDGLRGEETLGANVTSPYKEAAPRYMDRLHETARFVGAINTIVSRDGALEGFNTDVPGFQKALAAAGFDPEGSEAVIWGAGGAARAVAWALVWRKAGALTIINRTAVRAGRLRHDLSAPASGVRLRSCGSDDPAALEALAACDLVVQCTPVGLRGSETEGALPFPVEALPSRAMVVDLVANPVETRLVQAAKARGHAALGGLPMLVHQGAAAFELWTQQTPPLAVMFAAAEAAMAAEME